MQNEPNNLNSGDKAYVDLSQIPQATLQGHMWRQEGTQLKCMSCSFQHATFIEPGYQLYGIDDEGKPMIRPFRTEARPPKT